MGACCFLVSSYKPLSRKNNKKKKKKKKKKNIIHLVMPFNYYGPFLKFSEDTFHLSEMFDFFTLKKLILTNCDLLSNISLVGGQS